MSLSNELSQIFELPDCNMLYNEATAKLIGTIMYVNGEKSKIKEIQRRKIFYRTLFTNKDSALSEDQVKELKIFLPPSGVYLCENRKNHIVLFRKPLRQWHKSYTTDLYTCISPDTDKELFGWEAIEETRKEIWVTPAGSICYYTQIIGYIENTHIVCTNHNFKQELIDWSRDVQNV